MHKKLFRALCREFKMMFVKNVYFRLLYILFVTRTMICSVPSNINSYFLRWLLDDIRINNVDVSFYDKSLMQCAGECLRLNGCVSFNWHTTMACELNTKLFNFSTFFERSQHQWRVYEKGGCGLGIRNGNHCIMVPQSTHPADALSFLDGRNFCSSGYADLVKITSQTEMSNLNQVLNRIFPSLHDTDGKIWTGLNKINTTDFVWSDTTDPIYSNYAQNEPDRTEDCVLMTNYQNNWMWKTDKCSNLWTFACERRDIE